MHRDFFLLGFAILFTTLVGAAFVLALRDHMGEPAPTWPAAATSLQATSIAPTAPTAPTASTAPMTPTAPIAPTAVSPTATPSSAEPTTAVSVPAANPRTHTVQAGETMFRIATNHRLTVAELAAANNISDPTLLYVGQILTIPGQENEQQPTPATSNPLPATSNPLPATSLNSLPLTSFIIMPPNVRDNARAIFAQGQQLGRNPHAFAKIGDSTITIDHFLSRFDSGPYNLGDYTYLQRVIDHFPGSFARDSAAVRIGLHAWTVFDPIWANKSLCGPNETVIACEFRLHNPAIVLIRLGANDVGAPGLFADSMRQIVQYAIDNGVIPVLGTKADRNEGSNQNNDILRQIAADYQIPLWEFDLVAGTLPGRGLDVDGVHMNTFYAHDYTQPEAFQRGHALHNLTALMMLDALLAEVILPSGS